MNTMNTKERTITIHRKDVFFDIDFLSLNYSEGTGDVVRANSVATETEAAGSGREMGRLAAHRVNDLRQLLSKFLAPVTATTADNTLEAQDWVFALRLSTETEDNILGPATDLMHDYIVSGTLADYYAQIGVTGNIESLRLRADADLARIRELIYNKPMP